MAAKAREEELERKRQCQLRTYSTTEAKSYSHLSTTVSEPIQFPSEERRNRKVHTFRKPVVPLRDPEDDAEAEADRRERENRISVHGLVRRNMRRGSAQFADSLRSSAPPAIKPPPKTPSTITAAANKLTFSSNNSMRTARKELFAHSSTGVVPATHRRSERKARAAEREQSQKEEEKQRKEKLYHQARSTYLAPTHSHAHEKVLLKYAHEHPELVDETLLAHHQYVANNRLSGIGDSFVQQQARRSHTSTSTVAATAAQAELTAHTFAHATTFPSFPPPAASPAKLGGGSNTHSHETGQSHAAVDAFGSTYEEVFHWGQ